jgi:hypothetical protein
MSASRNDNSLPSRRRDPSDLSRVIDGIAAVAGSVYLVTRSVVIAVTVVITAALLVAIRLIRQQP